MTLRKTCLATLAVVSTSLACAQADPVLRDTVQKAMDGNPEVSSRANALRAGADGVDIARGGLLPRVELSANAGRTEDTLRNRNPERSRLNETGVALSVSQLLWDGMTTRRDVDRAQRERAVRWFELSETNEQVALEAARAHFDVLRFRRLVQLAEDNYVQHRYVHGLLSSRVKAGVGRGVDLEQAGARLALAESNLTSESANLHDVTARFQRVVGTPPVAGLTFSPLVADGMAPSANDAVAAALASSPAVSAAIENLRAARAAASASEGAYQPRVEARVRGGGGQNFDGVVDQRRDVKAEVVLAWNLFNGGADQARVRQGANLLNQAADLRDRICRDTRQNVSIAFSDVKKLTEQLQALDRNVLAIEKTRDAYRQQFDIGQRSLLDLLNSENELYTARRSHADALFDLSISHGRYLASNQRLTRQLGLSLPVVGPAPEEFPGESADRPERCPPQAVEIQTTSRADLDARAAQLIRLAPPAAR